MRIASFSIVLLLLQTAQATADSKDDCSEMIESAGFAPEEPYRFERGGFFAYDKHVFGSFTCSIDASDRIVGITKGETIVAEDGFVGIEAIQTRDAVTESAEGLLAKAAEDRDRALKLARDKFAARAKLIESRRSKALDSIREGTYSEEELSFFSVDVDRPSSSGLSEEIIPAVNSSNNNGKKQEPLASVDVLVDLVRKELFVSAFKAAEPGIKGGVYSDLQIRELEEFAYRVVRSVPASNVTRNIDGYKFLALINPSEPRYRGSLGKYESIKQNKQKVDDDEVKARRFEWIASRLNSTNTEAQREIAFKSVSGQKVKVSGRISDVERKGIILPPAINLDTEFSNLNVACYLPYDTPETRLTSLKIGQRYDCVGSLENYTFLFGATSVSVSAEK